MNGTRQSSLRISDVLACRAAEQPEAVALHFLADDATTVTLTYADLHRRAQSVAAALRAQSEPGARALLLLPSGPDYVAAFFGCLYAGMIAVPVYPPQTQRIHHGDRLAVIARDAQAQWLLGDNASMPALEALRTTVGAGRCIAVDALPPAPDVCPLPVAPESVAFLQYTSGSTAAPKGVEVTHANLMANERAIARGFAIGERDVFVSWLPLYHDMGLIGGLLQPVYSGIPLVLMSPEFFLERPLRWLRAISRFGGTISGGPDFSYRLCVDRIPATQLAELDLRSWRAAFSGAEPVRYDTLRDFATRFGPAGLGADALHPSYGLAEATLFVAGKVPGIPLTVLPVDAGALAHNRVCHDSEGWPLVDCGVAVDDHAITIVDPHTQERLPDDGVGEIWISGPSVARGYWNNAAATRATFVERDGVRYLRSGDLGFLRAGHLFVAGRLKDLIIVRGQNLYPQDVEQTVEGAIESARKGRVAAFAVEIDGRETIGVAVEIKRRTLQTTAPEHLAAGISAAVAQAHQEAAAVVVLLNPGALPKTTSGKLQRSACKTGWRDGTLDAFAVFEHGRRLDPATGQPLPAAPAAVLSDSEAQLAALWCELLGIDHVDPADHFFVLGGNSLSAAQLCARLRETGRALNLRAVFEAPTLRELAAHLDHMPHTDTALPLTAAARNRFMPQSYAQSRLWFLAQLAPDSATYNLALSLHWRGALAADALREALQVLVRRHEILRTTFHQHDGAAVQQIHDDAVPEIECRDLRDVAPEQRDQCARGLLDAAITRPFDLQRGSLLRVALCRLDDADYQLCIVTHHIVADGWSLAVFVRELAHAYAAARAGVSSSLPPLPLQYADFAVWQRDWLGAGEGERQLAYWRGQLGGEQPLLALPGDRPRPPVQTYRGASLHFAIDATLSAQLRALARAQDVTVFMVLLAAFQVLLARLSGQTDIRVGVPVANRARPALENLIGFFVNTVVLRSHIDGDALFVDLLRQVKTTALDAQAHQDIPFEQLVDALQPQRSLGHNPLFQAKFNYGFAVPAWPADDAMRIDGAIADQVGTHFDLALDITDADGGLDAVFSYATDLFDDASVARWRDHYLALLRLAVAAPERRLAQFAPVAESVLHGERREFAAQSVLSLIARCDAADPTADAIRNGTRSVSRGALRGAALCLAQALRARGIGREHKVLLCAERSPEWVLGLLGVLQAGAAYVPLDPSAPPERLRRIAADCDARCVLTDTAAPLDGLEQIALDTFWAEADIAVEADAAEVSIDPAQTAYVIYTSGSTGEPKGVVVSHGALANYVQGLLDRWRPAPGDGMALVSSVAADLGHTMLFGALCAGGVLHLPEADCVFDADRFAEYMARHAVAALKIVPSHLRGLLQGVDAARALPARTLILGGEPCDTALLSAVHALRPTLRVINHYGPTETTVGVLTAELNDTRESPEPAPLGTPLPNTRVLVLDADMNPAPFNTAGDLYIGGAGLAQGYLGRAALTAERFVPDPFGHGVRLYRSGDRARCRDGVIEFLGRSDDQVKIRGYRVEPGEAAQALRAQPGVRDAAAIAVQDAAGARLIGYCAMDDAQRFDEAALKQRLRTVLPEYLVPARIVALAQLPLTANGKLDRRALPLPAREAGVREQPATALEQQLAALWVDVLPGVDIGVNDNFFELGGDSILSLKLIARARRQALFFSPKQLFEAQTIRALATLLEQPAATAEAVTNETSAPITRIARTDTLPLSHAQRRLWFLWQLEPRSEAYNVAGSLRLRGALDAQALQRTFDALAARHETLRSSFPQVDGQAVLRIHAPQAVAVARVDLRDLPRPLRESRAGELAVAEARAPFDLAAGPLLRVSLLQLADDDHLLLVTLHHIVSDGWSINVLIDEFATGYAAFANGTIPAWTELPIQYVDYAHWQSAWLGSEAGARQLAYWRAQLGGEPPPLPLPVDFARPAALSYRGADFAFDLPAALNTALKSFAREHQVTLSSVLLAAFVALLYRYTGQTDLRLGVPVANRRWWETEGLIGFFVNMLVLRADVDGEPDFATLVARIAAAMTQAQQHQDLPFERLVEALNPERSLTRNPLFQITYNHRRREFGALRMLGALQAEEPVPTAGITQFDLTLNTEEVGDELRHGFTYSVDLFERTSIERMAAQFVALLGAALAQPTRRIRELPLHADTRAGAAVAAVSKASCLHELVMSQIALTPDAIAVEFGTQRMSYAELGARAQAWARRLRAVGVGPETLVGIYAERSPALVVALLAVLQAGGAYLPLDPDYPLQRIGDMLDDARPRVVLSTRPLRDRLPESACVLCLDDDGEPLPMAATDAVVHTDNPAYCIYTSGSTGRPKGVLITHRAIVNHMVWMREAFAFDATTVVLQKTPFSFDASVWEFWLPLVCGGRCVLAPPGAQRDPALLWRSASEHRVTVLQVVPSLLRALFEDDGRHAALGTLQHLFCGGEALPMALARQATAQWAGALWNLYGPTETTIDASVWRWADTGTEVAPIGAPIASVTWHVLDDALAPVPVGVLGELYIGGAGLARGYLQRAGLTADRFVPDPFSAAGARLYRSGDLARLRADGVVECAGRADQQVKLRGYRIELEEITARLRESPAVREACVVARAEQQLCAYVVADVQRLKADYHAEHSERGALIEQWESVFEATYDGVDAGPNFTGWNSSYTDAPIAQTHMQDWLDGTVARIAALRPQRLLEIGCGIGLLTQHLAPRCTAYCGTDLSAQALAALRHWLRDRPGYTHVALFVRDALNFDGIDAHAYDTVVLNSVVQYFPDADYLRTVCAGALRTVGERGAVFIGDVRHLGLLKAFHASVQLAKAAPDGSVRQLRQAIDRALAQDKELVLDPDFFHGLGAGAVEILLKRSVHDNELTRYRYDVVLREGGAHWQAPELTWQAHDDVPALCAQQLAARPPTLRLRALPNRRVARDVAAWALIRQWDEFRSVAELNAALDAVASSGEDPETYWALGDAHGYEVCVSWTPGCDDGRFDVLFLDRERAVPVREIRPVPHSTAPLATDPLLAQLTAQLGARLREQLRAVLPDYMVPAHIAVLDALPLTPSGKLDRAALPAPDYHADQKAHVAPRSAWEQTLAGLWRQVLRIDRVGVHDDFFELGGHSLLATQLVSRLRAECGVVLPLRSVFEHATLAAQAACVEQLAGVRGDADLDRFEALFNEVETL